MPTAHTKDMLDKALAAYEKVGKELNIIYCYYIGVGNESNVTKLYF